MPYLDARVYDNGLTTLDTEATAIHLTTAEAATYANVTSTTVGNAAVNIGAPGARGGGGRKVTVAAISNTGSVTGNGTASHYAIVDATNSRLLAAAPLSASQVVSSGNTFSLPAFDIGIPGPV